METETLVPPREVWATDPAAWDRRYFRAFDGACPACQAGQPILSRHTGCPALPCHVHARPAWHPRPAVPFARSALL